MDNLIPRLVPIPQAHLAMLPETMLKTWRHEVYIALEIGGGAALAGWHFANHLERMPAVFYVAAGMSLLGLLYLIWRKPIDRILGISGGQLARL